MAKLVAMTSALVAPAAAFVAPAASPAAGLDAAAAAAKPQLRGQPTAEIEQRPTAAIAGAVGLGALGLAAAVTRAAGQKKQASRVERRVAGIAFPITEKFDPLKLGSTDAKMERYTAVEIKHGRVAMIATVGYIMPEVFRFPGCENFQHGLGALSSIPVEGWVQLVGFVGFHEIFVKPRAGGMGSWDLGFGTELLDGIDDEELERRQTVERNNGRLAMVAIMGMMVQEGMFGKTPVAMLGSNGFWGPPVDVFIQDIPMCDGGAFCATKATSSRVSRTALRAEGKMSESMPYLQYPENLEGWVGGEKGFDPLGVTDALPVYWVREAELKHGRVCMLATVGWIATDLGMRFPGEQFQNVSTIAAHDKMLQLGIMGPFLATVGIYEIYSGWLLFNGWTGQVNRDAGDFFLGKNFLPKDEAKANEMRLKELENGRLAMLAFSGICTQAVLTGKTWPFL